MAAQTKDTTDTLTVLESFIGKVDGEERVFRAGELIRPSDPAVKKWPHMFGAPRLINEPKVERATAAPGEDR